MPLPLAARALGFIGFADLTGSDPLGQNAAAAVDEASNYCTGLVKTPRHSQQPWPVPAMAFPGLSRQRCPWYIE